ncbi:hypothetical protein RvY_09892-2 [Ramazzottius varieornatus]|nr:hypothetical protein RvY_09892-2 [Ramazzottius varieornatus]
MRSSIMNLLARLPMYFATAVAVFIASTLVTCVVIAVRARRRKRTARKNNEFRPIIGFFHPYCLSGGGGERVLWAALNGLGKRYPENEYVIYTGDSPEACMSFRSHVMERFHIDIPSGLHVNFVHLSTRSLLEGRRYPVLTMILQSVGSCIVGLEGLWKLCPDVFIDTTGHAFTLPIFRFIGGCRTAAYVHYPTISTDMLSRVQQRKEAVNNSFVVSRSAFLSSLKVFYYRFFAFLYGLAGKCCEVVTVNSTWTAGHIRDIWCSQNVTIIYPPCNVTEFLSIQVWPDSWKQKIIIVSIGQFRPEKDHPLQLRSLRTLLARRRDLRSRVELHFVGSCRNAEDEARVEKLRELAAKLDISKNIVFHLNAPFKELLNICQHGTIGLHSMWNEHFGIGVVECMAAGLVTVAHNSGGPKADILKDWEGEKTGFLADDEYTYSLAIENVIRCNDFQKDAIRTAARSSVSRFTDEVFMTDFVSAVSALFVLDHSEKL